MSDVIIPQDNFLMHVIKCPVNALDTGGPILCVGEGTGLGPHTVCVGEGTGLGDPYCVCV